MTPEACTPLHSDGLSCRSRQQDLARGETGSTVSTAGDDALLAVCAMRLLTHGRLLCRRRG